MPQKTSDVLYDHAHSSLNEGSFVYLRIRNIARWVQARAMNDDKETPLRTVQLRDGSELTFYADDLCAVRVADTAIARDEAES